MLLNRYTDQNGLVMFYQFFPDNSNIVFTRAVFNIFDAFIKVGACSKSLNSAGLIFVGLF